MSCRWCVCGLPGTQVTHVARRSTTAPAARLGPATGRRLGLNLTLATAKLAEDSGPVRQQGPAGLAVETRAQCQGVTVTCPNGSSDKDVRLVRHPLQHDAIRKPDRAR